ncbi:MAG: acetyl-CoA carboxylase biotin carboxyl carrier protein [Pelotomaculum sp.]|jgi:oxaloacetate decarboxylase alpha subunit
MALERRVKITDTTLRDAHQSLWATRMHTEDMLPILEKLDNIGYHSLEVWGGATFDVCLRYLNEDPWERLRLLKKHLKKTPLQMLLRGQSLVGYRPYPDDVVEAFVERSVANGIDIIRIFDALNDLRNLKTAMAAAKKAGAHVQAAIVYTVSPVHTDKNYYLDLAKQLVEMGTDSICIKDMAGLLAPYPAYELVKLLKDNISIPLQLHCHYIGGLAVGTYLKAAEAGVDIIDTASVPLAFGASQPPVETVVRVLSGSVHDTGLDIHKLFEIAEYFEEIRKATGSPRGFTRITDMRVFDHQVPGGMISNYVSQLEEQNASHRINEILEEIPRVREDLGYPPLVTPTSQIVGTQAVLNVLCGERYKLIPDEVKDYLQGLYGKPPAPVDEEVLHKALKGKKPIDCRPADLLEPKMDKIREEIKDLAHSDEDVLSYALFQQVARRYFENREKGQNGMAEDQLAGDNSLNSGKKVKEVKDMNLEDIKELIALVNDSAVTEVKLESDGVKISIKKGAEQEAIPVSKVTVSQVPESKPAQVEKKETAPAKEENPQEDKEGLYTVVSPMVGTFYAAPSPDAMPYVKVGDMVRKGQTLCIVEAMKLMNKIESEVDGEIVEIAVNNAEPVEYGQPIFYIKVN